MLSALKRHDATSPSQTRPLIVLPTLYRVWAITRARQILAWMSSWAPQEIKGFIRGRSASDCWRFVACQVERALITGDTGALTGGVLDIIKCFDHLPRHPIFAAALMLGLPKQILEPWARYLSSLERRFLVFGHPSPGLRSTTGFPQGDPLSVVAMLIISLLWLISLKAVVPAIMPLVFADNWEWLTDSVQNTVRAMNHSRTFCAMLDLSMATSRTELKTWTWSTSPALREELRRHPDLLRYNCSVRCQRFGGAHHVHAPMEKRYPKKQTG